MKVVRFLFRIFNLIVYASFLSLLAVLYMMGDIDGNLYSIVGPNVLSTKGYIILSLFLLLNMAFILLFKALRTDQNIEWMYYICDTVIRITFTIPLCFIIYYYVISRFFPISDIIICDIIIFVLFFIWDYLMRWQIRFRMKANYFRTNNHL